VAVSPTGASTDLAGKVAGGRKLIAVVYADMVAYSRLIGLDDAGTLARLKALRANLIDPAIAEYGGKIVQTGGDSLLVVFDSIDGAVRCAVKVQQQVPDLDGDQPPDRAIRFRVGINIGDAIADGTDLHGDAVNVVARLQAKCPPGGICISRSVRDHIHGQLDLALEELGPLDLKNITHPVEAFVVRLGVAAIANSSEHSFVDGIGETLPLPDKPSIAVLAFANMSGDPEQEYFADGVVEDIITALSRTGWLFVIARNSSFAYKGKSPDIRAVGRELGVRYVLEGSIRKSAKRIRITCQLIEAATGGHVWADRFDGEMEDIFDLQDHITAAVVGAIEPSLRRAEIARATAKPTERLDAYDLYLRAWPYYNASGREASDTAIALLRRALEIDPTYVRAKALLASAYATRDYQQFDAPGDREMGIALARELITSNTDDPEALCRVGFTISQLAGDLPAAFTALNRALRLHPNSVLVLNRLAWVHCHANDPEPAIALWERAIRLSPLDPSMGGMLAGLGTAHLLTQQNAEALPLLQRAVEESPNFLPAHRMLIHALTRLGRLDEARAAAARLLEIRPDYRVGPAPTHRFSPAFAEERRQAELAAGLAE
jgi:adenylate cyclase